MPHKPKPFSEEELALAFPVGGDAAPPVLSPQQLAAMLGLSRKTIYEWISRGRLDGAFRRRGKHTLIWRDRALNLIFSGKEWTP